MAVKWLIRVTLTVIIGHRASVQCSPRVDTPLGSIIGVEQTVGNRSVDAFLGIPFGKAPKGSKRFSKPEPFDRWDNVLNATMKKYGCPQADQWLSNHIRISYAKYSDEDCLYLNIWRPQAPPNNELKKVFVFIYGGSFQWGSSDLFLYDGRAFAALNDMIFVSFNYRVGIFGFLNHPPTAVGDMGLWDQNLALKWINKNIQYFGGDPSEVTVCGQSAGAVSTAMHIISPHAKGLFKRAILQSGTSLTLSVLGRISKEVINIANLLGCDGRSDVTLDCLRNFEASKLVDKIESLGFDGIMMPSLDSSYVSLHSNLEDLDFNVEQILIGTTKHEAYIFARKVLNSSKELRALLATIGPTATMVAFLRNIFDMPLAEVRGMVSRYFDPGRDYSLQQSLETCSEAATDLFFACPAKFFAEIAAPKGVSVFKYLFKHRPSFTLHDDIPGVHHGDELPFTIGNLQLIRELLDEDVTVNVDSVKERFYPTAGEQTILMNIQRMWKSFSMGHPTLPSNVSWPRFTTSRRVTVEIAEDISITRESPVADRCPVWEKLILNRTSSSTPPNTPPTTITESNDEENSIDTINKRPSSSSNSPICASLSIVLLAQMFILTAI